MWEDNGLYEEVVFDCTRPALAMALNIVGGGWKASGRGTLRGEAHLVAQTRDHAAILLRVA